MKKTLARSKTFESDLTRLDKRLTRHSANAVLGHSNEFDYKRDAKYLCKVLKHCITAHTLDLEFLLHYLSSYNCEQRMVIVRDLEYEYNYKLIDMVLERPESSLRSCIIAMVVEPLELYARDFHDLLILKQTGKMTTSISRKLLEILLGLNNEDMKKFKEIYEQIYESTPEKDLEIVLGDKNIVEKLFIELLQAKRNEESNTSSLIAKVIAKKLYEAGEGTPGIDYDTFIKIFTHDSFAQLSVIFDIYEDLYKKPIQEAIQKEFQGDIETECFQDIVEYTRSPPGYYSKILRQVLEKQPIDYVTLIRTIIGHDDKDFAEIQLEYSKIYDETLDQIILQRVDIEEIKRVFIIIINKREDITADDLGHVRFDHVNNTHTPASAFSPTTTNSIANATGMRRNRSHEAFDKLVTVFKTIRPH